MMDRACVVEPPATPQGTGSGTGALLSWWTCGGAGRKACPTMQGSSIAQPDLPKCLLHLGVHLCPLTHE